MRRTDLVVGADGYRSRLRRHVVPGAAPRYAGYALWRGGVPVRLLGGSEQALDMIGQAYCTAVFPGGQALFYRITAIAPDGGLEPAVSWVLYARPPREAAFDPSLSYPPGRVTQTLIGRVRALARDALPAAWGEVVSRTADEDVIVQPVVDLELPRIRRGPVLLAGDASSLVRPHTAAGATKALLDALCLEEEMSRAQSLAEAMASYEARRREQGNQLVELGRRMGRDQVEKAPVWSEMTPQRMDAWAQATLAGRSHYLYGNAPGSRPGRVPAG
ncbi:hypothetical protein ABZ543_27280 [Streptomyces roseifaciens]